MRILYYLGICFLFLCSNAYSLQSQVNLDKKHSNIELQKDLDFIRNYKNIDSVKSFLIKTLNSNSSLAEKYYITYLERGIKENNIKIQFTAYYYLGDIAYEKRNYVQSIKHGKSALKIAEKQKHERNQIIALNQLGNVYYIIRKYDTSLNQYLKAYNIVINNDLKNLELHILGNLSMIRTRIHRYEEALVSYQKIIDLLEKEEYRKVPNYSGIHLSTVQGAGVCNFLLKKYDSALKYYNEGFFLAEKYKSRRHTIMFHMTSGEVYTAKEMYDKALYHLNKAKTSINQGKTEFDHLSHTTNYHIATVFYRKKEFEKALNYLSKSFDMINSFEKETQVEKIAKMYDLAYRAAEKLEDKELQLEYSVAYRRVIDSFYKDDIRTKDRLYDQSMNNLEEKNKSLSSQNLMYIIISITFVVIIIALSVYNYQKQQKNKKLFEVLQEQQKEKATSTIEKKEFVTDKKATTLFRQLKELEETKFFLDQGCNLYNTAKLIGTNTTYLSKVINEHQQKSFNDYINKLRVAYCIKEFESGKKFQSYTIKAIANELGYKSVNTFASAFKKQTGITHSYYIKQMLKKEKTERSN